jgi:hypothetical protein
MDLHYYLYTPCRKSMNQCITEISAHLSWSLLATKTTALHNYPFTFPISMDKSATDLPLLWIWGATCLHNSTNDTHTHFNPEDGSSMLPWNLCNTDHFHMVPAPKNTAGIDNEPPWEPWLNKLRFESLGMCHHIIWWVGANNSEEHAAKTSIIQVFECQFCAAARALLHLNANADCFHIQIKMLYI